MFNLGVDSVEVPCSVKQAGSGNEFVGQVELVARLREDFLDLFAEIVVIDEGLVSLEDPLQCCFVLNNIQVVNRADRVCAPLAWFEHAQLAEESALTVHALRDLLLAVKDDRVPNE